MTRVSALCCVSLIALLCAACNDSKSPAPVAPPVPAADADGLAANEGSETDHATVQVTQATFADQVLAADQLVLVDFWAPWCGPCLVLAPTVEEIAVDYEGRVKVAKVNVDEAPDLAAKYEIQAIPALLFFRGGQLVKRTEGALPKREITQTIDALLAP